LALYNELTVGPEARDSRSFHSVLKHPGTTVYGADRGGAVVAMVTLHLLPNVTWGGRPYGLIENVVTARIYRGQGVGKAVLSHAVAEAFKARAYKVILMTGRARDAKGFYESVGFSSEDKYAMVMRAPDN
jgi:GNAT superfamily N-acetyltransferase